MRERRGSFEVYGAPLTRVGADLDIETGILLQNRGDDGTPIVLSTLVLETLREQEAWAPSKRHRSVPQQGVKSDDKPGAELDAQSDIKPKLLLAGAKGNSSLPNVVGAWNFDLPTARMRQQENYCDAVDQMRRFRPKRHHQFDAKTI